MILKMTDRIKKQPSGRTQFYFTLTPYRLTASECGQTVQNGPQEAKETKDRSAIQRFLGTHGKSCAGGETPTA